MPSAIRHKVTECSLIGLALIVPLVSISTHRAIVPVCAIAALIVFFSIGPQQFWVRFLKANRFLVGAGLLFLVTLAASTLWAPDPARGAVTVGKITGSFIVGTVLVMAATLIPTETARRVTMAFMASVLALGAFLSIDALTGGALSLAILKKSVGIHYGHFWLKPAAAFLAIGVWPMSLYLWRAGQAWIAISIIIVAALTAYAIGANGVTVAMLGGASAGLIYCVLGPLRKAVTVGAFLILAGVILFQPFIIKNYISPEAVGEELTLNMPIAGSTLYRLYIWDFVSSRIMEKPVMGWGVGASRHIGDQEIIVDPKWGEIGEAVPLHPHNAFLQLQLELGVIGLVLSLVPIGMMLWRLSSPTISHAARFAGTGLLFSVFFQYAISFSVWSSWWNAAVLFSLAIMVAAWRSRDTDQPAA